jgi:hypothetical protein
VALFGLLLLGACSRPAPPPPDFSEARAWTHLLSQIGFGPRYPGDKGSQRQLLWLLDELKFRADTVIQQGFTAAGEGGRPLTMTNVVARFRPELKDRVLLVAHRDTRRRADGSYDPLDRRFPTPGANVNASGVAVLMELAQLMKEQPPLVGVDLLFADGDDFRDEADFAGTRHFLASMPGYRPRYAIVVQGVGDKLAEFPRDSLSVATAAEATARVWDAAAAVDADSVFVTRTAPPAKNAGRVLAAAGIPTVIVADREYGPDNLRWHSIDDRTAFVSRETLGLVGRVLATAVYREQPAKEN